MTEENKLSFEEFLASNWEFKGFAPDGGDIDASIKSAESFFSLPKLEWESEGAKDVHIFHAAFYRGAAWMLYKLKRSKGE